MSGLTGLLTQAVQSKQRQAVLEAISKEVAEQGPERTRSEAGRARAITLQRMAARLRSTVGDGVHAWVSQCPCSEATRLTDAELRFALAWRLGLPVTQQGACCLKAKDSDDSGRCGKLRDVFGDHSLLCKKGRGRYRAHNSIVWCLSRFAASAGVEAEKGGGLSRDAAGRSRRQRQC